MSSFNLNNIPGNQPIIQGAQSLGKDGGGGGNAGYMNMRNKKKKEGENNENENENDKAYLFEEGEADTFEREEDAGKTNKPKKTFVDLAKIIGRNPNKWQGKITSIVQKTNAAFSKSKSSGNDKENNVFSKLGINLNDSKNKFDTVEYEIEEDDEYFNEKSSPFEEQQDFGDDEIIEEEQ